MPGIAAAYAAVGRLRRFGIIAADLSLYIAVRGAAAF